MFPTRTVPIVYDGLTIGHLSFEAAQFCKHGVTLRLDGGVLEGGVGNISLTADKLTKPENDAIRAVRYPESASGGGNADRQVYRLDVPEGVGVTVENRKVTVQLDGRDVTDAELALIRASRAPRGSVSLIADLTAGKNCAHEAAALILELMEENLRLSADRPDRFSIDAAPRDGTAIKLWERRAEDVFSIPVSTFSDGSVVGRWTELRTSPGKTAMGWWVWDPTRDAETGPYGNDRFEAWTPYEPHRSDAIGIVHPTRRMPPVRPLHSDTPKAG